ncbi:MAG TPA: hypothetical protein VF177_07960 [Anaerolineae bacterium]
MPTEMNARNESPFVCDMTALEPAQREQHAVTSRQLFQAVQEVQELPDGYAFRLPNDSTMLLLAAGFVAYERLCCPFFGFGLKLEPDGGPLWLRLTGRAGVKTFIRAELGDHLIDKLPHH